MLRVVHRSSAWLGRWLLVAVALSVGAGVFVTLLPVPPTTLAASSGAFRTSSSVSCGGTASTHLAVPAYQSSASIQLSHTSGPAQAGLSISGTGWPAGVVISIDAYGDNSTGQLVLGQLAIVRATTDVEGRFQSASFAAPAIQSCFETDPSYGQPGSFVTFVAHTSDDIVSAEARYHYLDVFLSSPDTPELGVLPGSVIPITGQTWIPDGQITVTTLLLQSDPNSTSAQSLGKPLVHLTTDGQGAFTIDVVVPGNLTPQDALEVYASEFDPGYGNIDASPLIFDVLPDLVPTFIANFVEGYPGSTVTLTGTNWLSGTVIAEYCRGQTLGGDILVRQWLMGTAPLSCNPELSQGLGSISVHSGDFRIKVTIPENARPGPITIQVRSDSDIWPAIYVLGIPFTVLAPWQLVHPRLANIVHVAEVALPIVLLVAAGVAAVALWQRRRRRRRAA